MKNDEKKNVMEGIRGFFILAGCVLLLWLSVFFWMPFFFGWGSEESQRSSGTGGDMFGGITALFSGLAFAGLVTTLFMQRKELELQRLELHQTRDEFRVQRFENTFFGLLKLLNDHVNSLEVSKRDVGYVLLDGGKYEDSRGREALKLYSDQLPTFKYIERGEYNTETGRHATTSKTRSLNDVLEIYTDKYWKYLERDLAPYFRLIYNIIRHIEYMEFSVNENDNEAAKLKYSKFLRAHLSSAEVKLLMFNCASIHGEGLKPWVEKYSMLRHIRRDDYTDNAEIVNKYAPSAFNWEERSKRS